MAIGDAYATAAEYRAVIGGNDNSADTLILRQLKATSRGLERMLGQYFNKDVAATTRLYVGNGSATIEVEPIASTSGIEIKINHDYSGDFTAETALDATDYVLLPLNADKGPEPQPWHEIFIPGWSTETVWPSLHQVRVTAIHGWPAVPEAIHMATIELTAMALRLEGPYATQRIQEMEVVVNASPQARAILNRLYKVYNRYPIGVA